LRVWRENKNINFLTFCVYLCNSTLACSYPRIVRWLVTNASTWQLTSSSIGFLLVFFNITNALLCLFFQVLEGLFLLLVLLVVVLEGKGAIASFPFGTIRRLHSMHRGYFILTITMVRVMPLLATP